MADYHPWKLLTGLMKDVADYHSGGGRLPLRRWQITTLEVADYHPGTVLPTARTFQRHTPPIITSRNYPLSSYPPTMLVLLLSLFMVWLSTTLDVADKDPYAGSDQTGLISMEVSISAPISTEVSDFHLPTYCTYNSTPYPSTITSSNYPLSSYPPTMLVLLLSLLMVWLCC